MPSTKRRKSQKGIGTTLIALVILMITLVYGAISGVELSPGGGGDSETPNAATRVASDGWYSVYFTDPTGSDATSGSGGPDAVLETAIDKARLSVDMAIYDLDLGKIRNALVNAHHRGVTVRMVTDSDNLDEREIQALKDAGIPVLGDRREGLMHDKFAVIDRLEVWTGSMNFTFNDAYKNNNNLIRVRSSRLAQDYLAEFNEMFVDDEFGPRSPANTPYSTLSVDGTQLEVYFSPDDGTATHLIDLVNSARQSISFLAYSFTADDIASAMLARVPVGVTISGVFEESQYRSNTGTEYEHFRSSGQDIRLDGNPRNMHHKVILIDGKTVVTGSYNFSASAENSNDENTLVIHNAEIASLYLSEFQRVFDAAQP
ncbi:MAG TPA: phospholipase D-like domain-containing protein [Anaerolineales bacterium]|jgi:phosphatidylserine/phosphatidylglycerophosphate/cardiolipin synthase-like enzyme|nr:phospholipase D-like domain-containing protein [Anaerolineales bacterium]